MNACRPRSTSAVHPPDLDRQSDRIGQTIFDQTFLGACARASARRRTLCEEVCVREVGSKPVQDRPPERYATDVAMAENKQILSAPRTDRQTVAVVGAGPAGLAAAHRLAVMAMT